MHEQAERCAVLVEDLATARHAEQETARSGLTFLVRTRARPRAVWRCPRGRRQAHNTVHARVSVACRALQDSELRLGQALDQCKASDAAAQHAR